MYDETIKKENLTADDIQKLYQWKNGMPLSKPKQISLEKNIIKKLYRINQLKKEKQIDHKKILEEFPKGGAVWRIFLLHIINPKYFPIYDQNIHRAFCFMQEQPYQKISEKSIADKKKIEFYSNEYFPFIESIKDIEIRELDKAFFAFGKFIKSKGNVILVK